MSEGGTPEEQSTGQKVGIAIADGMKAYGDGVQKAYDGELDEDKFRTSEPPRRR
jgi:hypothetical protein